MTYKIPAQNISTLRARVADLNKRAAKLGVPALELVEVTSYCTLPAVDVQPTVWSDSPVRYIEGTPRTIHEVEVTGASIRFGGWHFLGSVEHHAAGNILRAAPGQTIPATFRDRSSECDHCGTRRSRKNTFVVEHWGSGETLQVGRQCTRDFLGHIDPDRLASYLTFLDDLDREPSDSERSRDRTVDSPVGVVAAAIAAIRATGNFRPASFDNSTASYVRDSYSTSKHSKKRLDEIGFDLTGDDFIAAQELIDWVAASDDSGDYMHNLRIAATLDVVEDKHIGLLASAPKARQSAAERQLEADRRAAEKAEREANSNPAPEGKVEVIGEVVKLTVLETDFGVTDKMIVAADGGYRVYVTVPSAIADVEAGERVSFTATLTRSDRDADFAFGKRPSKAQRVEA